MRNIGKRLFRRWRCAFVLFVMAGTCVCMPARAQNIPRELTVKRVKLLGDLPGSGTRDILVTKDGQRMAYVVKRDGKSMMFYDGKEGPPYDDINVFRLSPDGKHLAYRAKRGKKWLVVYDGREDVVYHRIEEYLVFSPDSKHFAYVATHDGLARDKENPVYVQAHDGKQFVVLDGKAGAIYGGSSVSQPVFSPDSKRLAFTVEAGHPYPQPNKYFIVLDGKKGPEYNEAVLNWSGGPGGRVFSPDSTRLAYYARRDGKVFIVCDDKEGPAFDSIGTLIFSADSKHVAYVAQRNDRFFVVLDGKESGPYEKVGTPLFSPDGGRLAYRAKRGGTGFVVCDGKEGPAYDEGRWDRFTNSIAFSPDGKHVAYVIRRGGNGHIVFDGKEGPAYSDVRCPFFSPDGKHFAYIARRGRQWFIVCDGREGQKNTDIRWAFFSPDSRHLLCVVMGEPLPPTTMALVCDGVRGPMDFMWGGEQTSDMHADPPPWNAWAGENVDKKTEKFRWISFVGRPALDGKPEMPGRNGWDAWLVEIDMPGDLDWTNGFGPPREANNPQGARKVEPDERAATIREALDPRTSDKTCYSAVGVLLRSDYSRESAEALAVLACDPTRSNAIRHDAAMGLIHFKQDMPADVEGPIRQRLCAALETEKEKLQPGVIFTLVFWGEADRVYRVLGDKLRDHPREVIVLEKISSREIAVARLWEIYQAAPAALEPAMARRRGPDSPTRQARHRHPHRKHGRRPGADCR